MGDINTRYRVEFIGFEDGIKKQEELRQAQIKTKEEAKRLQKALKDIDPDSDEFERYTKELAQNQTAQKNLADQIRKTDKEVKDQRKEVEFAARSMGGMEAKAKKLRAEMRKLDLSVDKDKRKFKELRKELDNTEKELADMSVTTGRTRAAFGSLGGSKGIGAAAAGIGAFFALATGATIQLANLAGEAEGVQRRFEAFEDSDLILQKLKDSTNGTVSELNLMKRAITAANFDIPIATLAKGLEFAKKRANETGQSIDFLVNSMVNGLGRKSPLILDNLGIGQAELSEEVKNTGDFYAAVANIIDRDLGDSGEVVDTVADKQARLNAEIQNLQLNLATKLKPAFADALVEANKLVDILGQISEFGGVFSAAERDTAEFFAKNQAERLGKLLDAQLEEGSITQDEAAKQLRDRINGLIAKEKELSEARQEAKSNIPFVTTKEEKQLANQELATRKAIEATRGLLAAYVDLNEEVDGPGGLTEEEILKASSAITKLDQDLRKATIEGRLSVLEEVAQAEIEAFEGTEEQKAEFAELRLAKLAKDQRDEVGELVGEVEQITTLATAQGSPELKDRIDTGVERVTDLGTATDKAAEKAEKLEAVWMAIEEGLGNTSDKLNDLSGAFGVIGGAFGALADIYEEGSQRQVRALEAQRKASALAAIAAQGAALADGLKAVGSAFTLPFPAGIVAGATLFGQVVSTFAAFRNFASAFQLEEGGNLNALGVGNIPQGGGEITGPLHSSGGIPAMFGGTSVEVEGGEGYIHNGSEKYILTRGAMANPVLRQMASDLNVAGGGKPFSKGKRKFKFQDGGILGGATPGIASFEGALSSSDRLLASLDSRFDRMEVIVDPRKVKRANDRDGARKEAAVV